MYAKKIYTKTIILPFSLLIMALLSASCAVNTGNFGVGNPTALPSKQSLESLKNYANYLKNRISIKQNGSEIELLDPLTTNRVTRIEYAKASRIALKTAAPGDNAIPSVPENSNTSLLPNVTDVKIYEASDKPGGLLMDKISTLEAFAAHKQRFFDLACLYNQSPTHNFYKVFFTLWVEPERQDLWSYSWRWADYYGFRNYTKDYHADVTFNTTTPEATVVRLEPGHEGSISDEYYAFMNQSELGISAQWQDIAAKGDLAERLRQAEVEQRKYPVLRSIIESGNKFHYIISPRQHVEERTFSIPFLMNPYTNTRRIDSVPYDVSAYFMVPKKEQTLKLRVTACYKEFGKPEHNCKNNQIKEEDSGNDKAIVLTINLPSTMDFKVDPECNVSSPAKSPGS